MKNRLRFSVVLLAVLLLAGCQCKHDYDQGQVSREATCREEGVCTYTCQKCGEFYEEPIPLAEHIYSGKVTREPTYEQEGEQTFTCTACKDSYTQPIPALEKPVEVTVTGKESYEDYLFDWIELDFQVRNLGDREIRGVRGELAIMDLFGKEIKTVRCSFTQDLIPAREVVEIPERPMLISSYEEADAQLFETDFENLQFAFSLTHVVYTQPEPQDEEPEPEPEDPVTVTVVKMLASPADFSRRQVYSSVQLTIDTRNNTGKELKALEGTITIRDMFGEELETYQCDLYAYKAYTVVDGADRQNFFITFYDVTPGSLTILYSEFEELEFEYTLYTILYEDGTREVLRQGGTSV